MKKIGILGGIGPESTVEYYKRIIYGYRKLTNDANYPPLVINSINMTEMLGLVSGGDNEKLADFLAGEINKLKITGADYVAIASNTPHCVINELTESSAVPIISIVDETCGYAKEKNLKKVLLTGTIFTMKKDFYQKSFNKYDIECIVPDDDDKAKIHNIIFPNLEDGIILEKDKIAFLDICGRIIGANNVDGIVLGCTELPLLVNQNDFTISVLDTMEIHINSIVAKIL